ncbi:pentatricopeptide repeat-containing protein At2g17525, mitochondrial [Silene latifolia]|uniref:pentatricopeptide repeat-containing protein At2g17525, mitochondrial n=1 Tax=Silene latifolia TaxID=37657 RepID=UPI003D7759A5
MPIINYLPKTLITIVNPPLTIITLQSRTLCQLSAPTHDHIAQLILDNKSPSQAFQTFKWASKLPNFTHNQSTYRAMIHKLCSFRRFDDAHQLLDEMPSSIGSPPDEDIFITLVRGLGRAKRVREVIRVPDLARKFGLVPSLKVYNSILDVLVKEDISIARGFYREKMMGSGFEGDEYTYGILMKGLCVTNRIRDGFKLLQVMKTRGLSPNTVIYNTLLHSLCRNGKVSRARSLMSEMVKPDDVTYNLMISAYCKEGYVVQAQVLLEKSLASGCIPSVVATTKVIDLLCNIGRVNDAAEVLDRVERHGGVVDVVAYNTLIKGFCSSRKAKVGLHFKKQMENKGYLPNIETYNTLIAGFCDVNLLDVALDLFSELKVAAIDCNFVTYDTLIQGFCSKGRVDDAFRFLELMEESKGGSGGRISPYNSIIFGLYRENRLSEALVFLNQMSKMFPRAVDRTLTIIGLCEDGNLESAKEVYEEMLKEGGTPSVLVYHSLIQCYSKHSQFREAFQLMNEMVGSGFPPVSSTCNAVISGFCEQGKIASALDLIKEMEERGCSLDVGSYRPLIVALRNRGDLQEALKMFRQMLHKGIKPDYSEFNGILPELRD